MNADAGWANLSRDEYYRRNHDSSRPRLFKSNSSSPGLSYQCRKGQHNLCSKLNCTCAYCQHPPVGRR